MSDYKGILDNRGVREVSLYNYYWSKCDLEEVSAHDQYTWKSAGGGIIYCGGTNYMLSDFE